MDLIIDWDKSYRIISAAYPPISLFEDVADPDEFEILYEIQAITNPRIRDEVGEIELVPKSERVTGPGSSWIMGAFTHLNESGSPFSDGTFGVYYSAEDVETAINETKYHRQIFLLETNEDPIEMDMRILISKIHGDFYQAKQKKYLLLDDYSHSQELARNLKKKSSDGVVYESVRGNGLCVGVFKANKISNCRHLKYLCYCWDGKEISNIYEKKPL